MFRNRGTGPVENAVSKINSWGEIRAGITMCILALQRSQWSQDFPQHRSAEFWCFRFSSGKKLEDEKPYSSFLFTCWRHQDTRMSGEKDLTSISAYLCLLNTSTPLCPTLREQVICRH